MLGALLIRDTDPLWRYKFIFLLMHKFGTVLFKEQEARKEELSEINYVKLKYKIGVTMSELRFIRKQKRVSIFKRKHT